MHETHCLVEKRASTDNRPSMARGLQPGSLMRTATAVIGFALLAPASAIAHDTLLNIDTDNIYRGYVGKHGNRVVPWVRTFFIQQGNCARFQVESQHTDLEMVVIAPNQNRYRNDNGAAPNPCGATCPIVRINDTPFTHGFYTVHVSPKDGGGIEGEFLLRVNIKGVNDPFCTPATPAF